MSRVLLLAADRGLPLYDVSGGEAGHRDSFRVQDHEYYREAVDALEFSMKPYQYELELGGSGRCLRLLKEYLAHNLFSGETVELWSLWVGTGGGERPRRYRGRLDEFDLDTLGMLTEHQYEPDHTGEFPEGLISQVCLTVEV